MHYDRKPLDIKWIRDCISIKMSTSTSLSFGDENIIQKGEMGEVQAPYYTHSNLTLFPKLEDWIFFIKLSLLFTHSRGPLALGTKRSRRGGGREEKKQKEKNGLIVGCEAGIILVWGGE